MKTDCIEIKYSLLHKKFYVHYERSDVDRVKHKSTPYPIGFYHFDRKIGVKKAFKQLKKCIINSIEKDIAKLKARLFEYQKVELPQWIIDAESKYTKKSKYEIR